MGWAPDITVSPERSPGLLLQGHWPSERVRQLGAKLLTREEVGLKDSYLDFSFRDGGGGHENYTLLLALCSRSSLLHATLKVSLHRRSVVWVHQCFFSWLRSRFFPSSELSILHFDWWFFPPFGRDAPDRPLDKCQNAPRKWTIRTRSPQNTLLLAFRITLWEILVSCLVLLSTSSWAKPYQLRAHFILSKNYELFTGWSGD